MSVEVKQSDREAAEPFRLGRGGKYDLIADALAQAFAAHRHQAEEAMRERAAKEAEASASICPPGHARIAARIAAAIRSIDTRGE